MSTLAQVILEGLDASKPSPSIPGRLYFTTDTNLIYYDTGSAWETVGPSGDGSGNATEIQGVPVSSTAPTSGQVLEYNGSDWVPTTPATGGGTPFGEVPTGTINGTNTVFTLTVTPIWVIVWCNYPLINGVGYTLSVVGGVTTITFTNPPQPASGGSPADAIYAQGTY